MKIIFIIILVIVSLCMALEVKSETVTGYSSLETCTDCITASGVPPFVGSIACPRNIPFWTQVEILGTIFVCLDRTHLRYNGRYDIYFGDGIEGYNRAIKFGKKNLKIKILN